MAIFNLIVLDIKGVTFLKDIQRGMHFIISMVPMYLPVIYAMQM